MAKEGLLNRDYLVSVTVQQFLPYAGMEVHSLNLSTPFWRVEGPYLLTQMIQVLELKKEDLLIQNRVIPQKKIVIMGISKVKGKIKSPDFAAQTTDSTDPDFQKWLEAVDLSKPLQLPRDIPHEEEDPKEVKG